MVCLMLGDFRGLCKYGASVISFLLEFQICSYIGLSWVLSPFSTFYLGPWSCCGGAGKAWTLTSWTQSWIQPLPLAHCANVSQSHGCCLLSTICVRVSRPPHIRQSAQPPCPVTDGQTESTHTLSPHGSWVMKLALNPGVSDGFLQGEGLGRGRFSLGWGLGGAQLGWLWAPNPSFGKSSMSSVWSLRIY